jgi:hypothetical protein
MDDAKELWSNWQSFMFEFQEVFTLGGGQWAVGSGEGGKDWVLCIASLKCSFVTSLLRGESALSLMVYGE